MITREKFCKNLWEYYLVLESDFLERYVSFELGENLFCDSNENENIENSLVYSNEYIKQYQAICSEIDVVMKLICKEIHNKGNVKSIPEYAELILNDWPDIVLQKVCVKHQFILQPFKIWKIKDETNDYKSPTWWINYNEVKHHRLEKYKKANLKNVINALAGLYILELYFVKEIGRNSNDKDVPNDISKLFNLINFQTKDTVFGRELYAMTEKDLDEIMKAN